MVAGKSECRVPNLNIEGYAADAGQQKGISFMVHFPAGSCPGHAGFAGQEHFNHFIFVCF
jgi:hypothetical protein